MLELCWYCDAPVDVDEGVDDHPDIHEDCYLDLQSGGAWFEFVSRMAWLKERKAAEAAEYISAIDGRVGDERAKLLSA